jgi:hypothetical protein
MMVPKKDLAAKLNKVQQTVTNARVESLGQLRDLDVDLQTLAMPKNHNRQHTIPQTPST